MNTMHKSLTETKKEKKKKRKERKVLSDYNNFFMTGLNGLNRPGFNRPVKTWF